MTSAALHPSLTQTWLMTDLQQVSWCKQSADQFNALGK
jgi:hypothetical protein